MHLRLLTRRFDVIIFLHCGLTDMLWVHPHIKNSTLWMKVNCLKLNGDKTKMIILSSPYYAKTRTHNMTMDINGELIGSKNEVRNLGIIFDHTMNMESNVNNEVCQTAYMHPRNISKIRHCITTVAREWCFHHLRTGLCKWHTAWPSTISHIKNATCSTLLNTSNHWYKDVWSYNIRFTIVTQAFYWAKDTLLSSSPEL